MSDFTVIKCDHQGREQLRYSGQRIASGPAWVCIEALFSFSDRDLGYVFLRQGDIFTEWFYADRWYNIFQVVDGQNAALKGWYCNITRPAQITDHTVAADDLALDLFVGPDAHTILLDEDEYESLNLPAHEQRAVQMALTELHGLIRSASGPFSALAGPSAKAGLSSDPDQGE